MVEKNYKELPLGIQIVPTTVGDIPKVLSMIEAAPEALISVSEEEIMGWIEKGMSLVAKTPDGSIVGHQAAEGWQESGWIEMRSAYVNPDCRGMGLNSAMKHTMIERIHALYPDATILGMTEPASGSRGILQKAGFAEISLDEVPDECFVPCPPNCYRRTGADCGCKAYVLKPE